MKVRSLPGFRAAFAATLATAAVVSAALCCAGCIQEIDLSDKYINEAVGLLRVQNTSAGDSYYFKGFELRDTAGEIIRNWEVPGKKGDGLEQGETWTGDVDREGLYTLYCTVRDNAEEAEELYEYGEVEIKLHQVTGLGIAGEACLVASDRDGDGFSDTWETRNGFNPDDPGDGGPVYVSSTGSDDNRGTEISPYLTLAKGVEKAKSGLTEDTRTVVVTGVLTRATEGPGDADTSVFSITDTGLRGVTIVGGNPQSVLDAIKTESYPGEKRALYLGPGTKVTLKNITIQNGVGYRGGGIHAKGTELTLGQGLVIEKCASQAGSSSGGGLYAGDGTSVIMESGSLIRNNTGVVGAAVTLLNGSSLTMQGGSLITGNQFDRGGAVEADLRSQITLEPGAQITGNYDKASNSPGLSRGGGVRLTAGSTLLMKGGLISGNIMTLNGAGGGGVYVGSESVFEMRDGEISGNIVGKAIEGDNPAVTGNGGGVYVDSGGVFNMSGGTIASNTATDFGGGVYVDKGNFFKTGGVVYGSGNSGNTAGTGYAQPATGKGHAFFGVPGNPIETTLPVSFSY
jgi:hypothetical protein